ncbi:MAG: restriction endonuclease subunit S [Terrimicrobiaceae bacterium]|nr:restriction endonuclease subunit S [Terrimicrobiaceae bacterium]
MKQTGQSNKIVWPKVRLECVTSKVGSGATPRGGDAAYQKSGIPLVRSMNVHFNGFRPHGLAFIDETQAAELDNVIVQANDVFINITGASIGRVTLAPPQMAGARVNQHVCIIRTTDILDPRFLAYFLVSAEQQALIQGNQTGGTRQALTKGQLLDWKCPLPARREQRRIIELLERADALRRQRADGDALASRILPALFQKFFGNLSHNTKNWHCDLLGSVIADTRNGLYKHADFYGRGTQVLKMFNILAGRLNLERVDQVEVTADEFASYRLEPGDILINRVNTPELVGKCAVIQRELGDAVFESKNIRVRLNTALAHPEYVAHFLNTSFGHATLCQGVKHAIGMATINNSDLRNCRLPLPPIELQTEWARHVAGMRKTATQAEASAKTLEKLFQVLLHRAFTGELTARWREAHMKELLVEMEQQAKALGLSTKVAHV